MSPTDEPLDPIDEVASALVDGEAVAPAGVDPSSPEVAARVAAFRRVAAAVAADPARGGDAVDEDRREQAIAAALAAFDEPAPVADLAAHRPARLRWLRPLSVAAALVAAVALGSVVLAGGNDDDRNDDSTTAAIALDDAGGAGETETRADGGAGADGSAGSAPAAEHAEPGSAGVTADATDTDASRLPEFLGSFATYDELVAAAVERATRLAATTPAPPATAPGAGSSAAPAPATTFPFTPYMRCPAPEGSYLLVTQGWIDSQPVEVYVIADDAGSPEVVVVRASDCSTVDG